MPMLSVYGLTVNELREIYNEETALYKRYLLVGGVRTVRTYFCTFSNANISASRSFLGNLECAIVFSTLELYG